MALDIPTSLNNLKNRRRDYEVLLKSLQSRADYSLLTESFEKRAQEKSVQYALGAMQAVDREYTDNSIKEGNRVKNQLINRLSNEFSFEFEFQGSVPLDVHIKGTSDIDLLMIRSDFLNYHPLGPAAQAGFYSPWNGQSIPSELSRMRTRAEEVLKNAFPEATVDISGSKSIALSGASLRRKVDVVPSNWNDTPAYQARKEKKDRGIEILIKDKNITFSNLPFLHIHEIHNKDIQESGGPKKVIRMLKNIRADSDRSEKIKLNSYEIAGLVWHFEPGILNVYSWHEITLLAIAQQQLKFFVENKQYTMRLRTPDDTRTIIDTDEKFSSLIELYVEVTDLAEKVAKEIKATSYLTHESMQRTLREAIF